MAKIKSKKIKKYNEVNQPGFFSSEGFYLYFLPLCFLLLAFYFLLPSSAYAGTITGTVAFDGTAPENPEINMDADPVCKAAHPTKIRSQQTIVNSNQTLKNVFVYIKDNVNGTFETPKAPLELNQLGCMYDPHVFGVQAGRPLSIVNSDATLHNVHAICHKNPEFNLGMPLKGMKMEKTFFNPEVMVKFKCDVHPWMSAYGGVLPHPFFAVTGDDGSFNISGLPAGEYTLEAWHETYGMQTQKIKVGESDTQTTDFKFSATQIADEATGVAVKVEAPKPQGPAFDDSAAINQPRQKTGWWLPEDISTFGPKIDFIFYVILIITGIVFFGVQGTLIYFLIRYRSKPGAKAYHTHGSHMVEVIWTAIPAVILVILAFMGQGVWAEVKMDFPKASDAVQIRVKAEQFAWNIQYPGPDGEFGTEDDVRNINQLHIPVDKDVLVTLISIPTADKAAVIHSFFLPEVRLKQDVVPGMEINVWFKAKRTGQFEIACAEFCGLGHYRMRGFLTIHSQEGFNAWLKEQAVA